jgi:hypothetical protein
LPKMFMQRTYAGKSEAEQRRMIGESIKRSSAHFKINSVKLYAASADSNLNGVEPGLKNSQADGFGQPEHEDIK